METQTTAQQVRDAITSAFPEQPVPKLAEIVSPLDAMNALAGEATRRDLAGRTWRSLTPTFLATRWSSFCYLTPAAYGYYLPALLTGALQEFSDESGLLHSVVFSLPPSYWSLYYEGEDHGFQARQSALSPDQYRAVCAFLGLVFQARPGLRHLAAQALRWGWNRLNTPALEMAWEYYGRLHAFSYPEPEDPDVAVLYREIRDAFAVTPYPGDDRLCGSEQGDEPAEYAMELRGLRWQAVHPELLARCYAALSFLSDVGFRYFLPAFVLADLLGDEMGYGSNADPVFSLTHGLYDERRPRSDAAALLSLEGIVGAEGLETLRQADERSDTVDWWEYSTRRFAPFSREERAAIIRYLEYRSRDGLSAPEVGQALDRYWRPSLQGSVG